VLTASFPFHFLRRRLPGAFLLFTLLAFYGFRTERWALGGLAGAIAGATRAGILMWPALAWVAWRAAKPTSRDRIGAAAGGRRDAWVRRVRLSTA
jgi:hypothetical protein